MSSLHPLCTCEHSCRRSPPLHPSPPSPLHPHSLPSLPSPCLTQTNVCLTCFPRRRCSSFCFSSATQSTRNTSPLFEGQYTARSLVPTPTNPAATPRSLPHECASAAPPPPPAASAPLASRGVGMLLSLETTSPHLYRGCVPYEVSMHSTSRA